MGASNMQRALLGFAPTRMLLTQFALPKPGEGPDKNARETGMYDVLYVGTTADNRTLRASVYGDKDPGYGSTSKMISEAALTLNDTSRQTTPGGIWTPAAAMGDALIARLQQARRAYVQTRELAPDETGEFGTRRAPARRQVCGALIVSIR
jgi:short subunit dehydrogenase-like uncharacterized protein